VLQGRDCQSNLDIANPALQPVHSNCSSSADH